LAIGLHNFPEGLATFVAALQNPKVGAVLAVAIAIHNIPEGMKKQKVLILLLSKYLWSIAWHASIIAIN